MSRRRRFGGLVVRREAWLPSWRGWLLAVVFAAAAVAVTVRGLYPFLALTARVPSRTLVIDGWLPTVNLRETAHEYQIGHYDRALVVSADYDFTAIDQDPGNLGAVRSVLIRSGIPTSCINGVLVPGRRTDRTYFAALAVKGWFAQHHLALSSIDLMTLGPHARRSRLLYRRALGPEIPVGVVALRDPAYDETRWWRFSDGVREVLFEGVAYLYVRLCFVPPPSA